MKQRLINRLLNVAPGEWPRILLAWHLNLFLRMGFVIGWTVTVAMFINRIGIEALPFLFVLNALLIMVGSIIYSYLIQKISRPLLIVYTVLMSGALLLLATLFSFGNDYAFFGLIILAQSMLISQLNILISLFTEDLFSPLESQRTFPLIATSETLGGILGGLTVGLLSGWLTSYKFIYLWILATFLIIPIILTSHAYTKKMPFIKAQKKKITHTHNLSKKAKKISQSLRKVPFLKGITVIVMVQFMLLTMIEFQYTKAVQEAVIQKHETVEVITYQPDSTLQVSLLNIEPLSPTNSPKAHSLNIENDITKNLGLLTMIFSFGSLIVQILIASRLIRSIGVVGTLLLHPIVTILNLLGMTINFNFFTAAMGRSNFEITGKLFKNAYHSSYYAIKESIRDHIKEFMEGFIKPLGTIMAFVVIFSIQDFAQGSQETLLINIVMIVITIIMAVRIAFLKKNYTEVSYKNLETSNDLPTRINALEILSQKGHKLETKTILKYLQNKKEKPLVKVKIIETLKQIGNPEAIPDLINCLSSEHSRIRHAAIEALSSFKELNNHKGKKYAFTRHRLIETSKELFHKEKSSFIRSEIIQMLAKIDHNDLIPFIITTLEEGDNKTKEACIKACRKFGDDNLQHYVAPYLDHKNQNVRAEAIVTLWPFEKLKNNLNHYLSQMKKSKRKESILATLYVLSETEREDEYPYIFKHLTSPDKEIKQAAAKALSKLNHRAAILHLADAWIENPQSLKKFTKKLKPEMQESIKNLIEQKISQHINEIMKNTKAESLEELEIKELEQLKTAYETVDEYHEAFKIETLIRQKEKLKKPLIPQNVLAT